MAYKDRKKFLEYQKNYRIKYPEKRKQTQKKWIIINL